MRILLFLAAIIASLTTTFSQNISIAKPLADDIPFTSVVIDETTPKWAKDLYGSDPNIRSIVKEYNKWKKDHPTTINAHTRNLKHYIAYALSKDAITKEGVVRVRGEQEKYRAMQARVKARQYQNRSVNGPLWTAVGPTIVPETQGRVNAQSNIYSISQSPSNPDILYAGSETSHVFKSVDRGESWTCMSDNYAFGGGMELEVHPSNPDIVYLGTRHDIYKTVDGGSTWQSVRYNWNQGISSIIIHPNTPMIVLAAGSEGIFRTTNGGASWTTITSTRVYDLKWKTDDPSVVFALWNNTVDNVTDFYRSTDTGQTWTRITNGWVEPNPSTGNSGGRMTVSDDYSGVIYTFTGATYPHLSNTKNGIKIRKSSDGGLSWQLLVDSNQIFKKAGTNSTTTIDRGQGYYDWDIEMVDSDTNMVFLGTQNRWLTHNGFSNDTLAAWGSETGGHSDVQEALFNGSDLWIATDGGLVKANSNVIGYDIKMDGINAAEYWSLGQGWNRDAQVATLYHNGTIGRTDTYAPGVFRFFGGAEPSFSDVKAPYPDQIISKGYGSVNGRSMPDVFTDPEIPFSYNLEPNANYAIWLTHEESEIEVLHHNYNTHYAGSGDKLNVSHDFGTSWEAIFWGRSESKITKIEIPKVNTQVMYFVEWHSSGSRLYKSTDGAQTFSEVTTAPHIGLSSVSGLHISCDHSDADVLYMGIRRGTSDNNKVWKTVDGGSTWTNINTGSDVFDDKDITDILAITGTDGGIYVTTRHDVYYRNNTSSWTTCNNGLPANLNIRHIKPFYKEGKIRIGTMKRGCYGADLVDQPTAIVPKATINDVVGYCERDTFQLEDYSVVNHSGASWNWQIDPAPVWISDANIRNPRVVFGSQDTFTVIMDLTVNGVTHSDTLDGDVIIESLCNPDDYAGTCYLMEDNGDHGIADLPGLELSEWTISLWMRPEPGQLATSTIITASDGTSRDLCINFYGTSDNLTLHYKGAGSSAWNVNPGMSVRYNEWNHVAVTSSVNTDNVTLYVNGEAYTYPSISAVPIAFEKLIVGWHWRWWNDRYYKGAIDELALYNRALTQDEIRLRMHITKDLTNDVGLLHYWQWNEGSGSKAYNKVSNQHMILPADYGTDAGPFSGGSSSKMDINGSGTYTFTNEGVEIIMGAGTYPGGEVVTTRLNNQPDFLPTNNTAGEQYWVMHNFGTNNLFTGVDEITLTGYGSIYPYEVPNPQDFRLFSRRFGQDGNTWSAQASASQIVPGSSGLVTSDNPKLETFDIQLSISKKDCGETSIVTTTIDGDPGSLRDIVSNLCPGDSITFDASLDGQVIPITNGEIDLNRDIHIIGNGVGVTILSANDLSRLFYLPDNDHQVYMQNLDLIDGSAVTDGGALLNEGQLILSDVRLIGNTEGGTNKAMTNYGAINIKAGTVEVKN